MLTPTRIWTPLFEFRVESANHYTMVDGVLEWSLIELCWQKWGLLLLTIVNLGLYLIF